jgi:four helix bundle protein
MPTITTFEDIEAWQEARAFVRNIYHASSTGSFAGDFALRDQLRRAAVSIVSNIAEGFERSSHREFARFLYMAKASAGEARAQLYVALDLGYLDEAQFRDLRLATIFISSKLASFIKYLQKVDANS